VLNMVPSASTLCNGPKYVIVYLDLIRIITDSFIDFVEFHIIIQGILILKSSICGFTVLFCGLFWQQKYCDVFE
jgi:hypothetical protein